MRHLLTNARHALIRLLGGVPRERLERAGDIVAQLAGHNTCLLARHQQLRAHCDLLQQRLDALGETAPTTPACGPCSAGR